MTNILFSLCEYLQEQYDCVLWDCRPKNHKNTYVDTKPSSIRCVFEIKKGNHIRDDRATKYVDVMVENGNIIVNS